jgi:hypothetical protein
MWSRAAFGLTPTQYRASRAVALSIDELQQQNG